jgi:hypothetical protein
MTSSHANLLAFCSHPIFQQIFIGVISVFDRLKKEKEKCAKGKGRVIYEFLTANSTNETILVDDDPMNLLDTALWIGEENTRCRLVQFADKKLTHKAAMIPRTPSIVVKNVKELISTLNT